MINQSNGFSVKIADVVIHSNSEDILLRPSPHYSPFVVKGLRPDINIEVHCQGIPDIGSKQKIFDSGSSWSLYSWREKYLFALSTPVIEPNLYKIAIFNKEFIHGEIHMIRSIVKWQSAFDPLDYPIDELLMVNYLSLDRGIDIHALGVAIDTSGVVFTGVSGAGKSTLAELWKKRNVKLLSDDRIVLRKKENRYWMYGTPWHGDARVSSPDGVPLSGLYFIKQSHDNRVSPLKPADAATRLLVRCFPTFYYVRGMEFTLNFISEVVQAVPCYEFEFTPDQRAIDEVLKHLERVSV